MKGMELIFEAIFIFKKEYVNVMQCPLKQN